MKKQVFLLITGVLLSCGTAVTLENYTMELSFSGIDWHIRSEQRAAGPGPNLFSAENVQLVDDKLQLRILPRGQRRWISAEIRSAEPVGYGAYRAVLVLPETGLPEPLIFGFFTYDQDMASDHREIDIEFGRFGNTAHDAPWLLFSLQPAGQPGRTLALNPPVPGGKWEIGFEYHEDRIDFYAFSASAADSVYRFSIEGAHVPDPGQMHLHLNLWLFRGEGPDRERYLQNPDDFLISIESVHYTP